MPWTKLSDDFSDDCWVLSDAAHRLHVEGLVWSNRKLLDCCIPKEEIRRFKCPEAVAELVERGWWADEDDVYRIVHHSGYQRPADQVLALQERNRKNGRNNKAKPSREQWKPKLSTTQMGSQVDSELGTQRDRTGQDRALEVSSDQEPEREQVEWPRVHIPGQGTYSF